MIATLHLRFQQDKDYLNPDQLGNFLLLFNKAYKLSLTFLRDVRPEEVLVNIDQYKNLFYAQLQLNSSDLSQYLEDQPDFECTQLKFNSPLSLWAKGNISALVLAVILSGGNISLFGATVDLPPVGVGITSLYDAFSHMNNKTSSIDDLHQILKSKAPKKTILKSTKIKKRK